LEKISACIITYNEEKKIRQCIESLIWCDEIIVMDSFSSDDTVHICQEYTPLVYKHDWLGYAGQKELAWSKARNPWILWVDADEEVSPGMKDEIINEFKNRNSSILAYRFPRQVLYLKKWISHGEWYPDYKLRLFQKKAFRIVNRTLHERVEVPGKVKTIDEPLYHYTYDNIYDHIQTINKFSSIAAQDKFMNNKRAHLWDLLIRPLWRFLRGYILKQGYRDGWQGLLIAILTSFEVELKYMKVMELQEGF